MKPLSLSKQFFVRHVRPKDAPGYYNFKCLPEPTVKEGVHQRVDSGIEIPQPPECVEQGRRYGVADVRIYDVNDEERSPK